jgi:pSer/pThr/pTyr-binding forkhead associated (FHA) protein
MVQEFAPPNEAPNPSNPQQDLSALHLVMQIGRGLQKRAVMKLSQTVIVGRGGQDDTTPSLDLSKYGGLDSGVSRVHARFVYRDHTLFVEDLGSTNGTRINGLKLVPREPMRLRNGDEIEFGQLPVTVRVVRAPR